MSGFEIAGIVLGAIPLVIVALEDYRQGKGLLAAMLKYHGLLDDLIHQLKSQKTFFFIDIRQLLQQARVAGVADEVDPSEEMCLMILRDTKTGPELERCLGHLYAPFLEILASYETCLKTIVAKLNGILRPDNALKDDLRAIIQASEAPNASHVLKSRVKFTMRRASLQSLVDDLRKERYSLKEIIKGMKTQREYEARDPSRAAKEVALTLTRVQGCAMSLFRAVCKSTVCNRHSTHKIMIRLENRVPDARQIQQRANIERSITFKLFLPVGYGILQEIAVAARSVEPATSKSKYQPPQEHAQSMAVPTITVTTTFLSVPVSRVQVTNICEAAQKAREQSQLLSLALATDMLELMEEEAASQQTFNEAKTLGDFLSETSQDENTRMTPKQQTLLALDVASSILQLRQTVWCSLPWNNMAIKFLTRRRSSSNTTISVPVVEQDIDAGLLETDHHPWDSDARATMIELAILLLEIWHHKSLEVWASNEGLGNADKHEPDGRMTMAIKWLHKTEERMPLHHLKAVEQCISLGTGRRRLWQDDEFQRQYCESIIKPLHESCRAW